MHSFKLECNLWLARPFTKYCLVIDLLQTALVLAEAFWMRTPQQYRLPDLICFQKCLFGKNVVSLLTMSKVVTKFIATYIRRQWKSGKRKRIYFCKLRHLNNHACNWGEWTIFFGGFGEKKS